MRLFALPLLAFFTLSDVTFAQGFEKSEFKASSGDILRYALLKPSKVETKKKYPMVITLHGVGGRGAKDWEGNCYANSLLAKPEMRKDFPCFVVAPTCAKAETWWSTGGLQGKERLPDVFELVERLIKELPVDPDRVHVTGQSMGGFGTFAAVVQRPDLFAAAAPVCGGHDPSNAKKISHVPIWVFHGAKDTTVPVERSREMVEAIKKEGGEPKYTEFPNAAHNSWTPAYNEEELWDWMFGQKRKKP